MSKAMNVNGTPMRTKSSSDNAPASTSVFTGDEPRTHERCRLGSASAMVIMNGYGDAPRSCRRRSMRIRAMEHGGSGVRGTKRPMIRRRRNNAARSRRGSAWPKTCSSPCAASSTPPVFCNAVGKTASCR